MRSPSFSVVIASYNYEQFVEKAVRSCLDQSYPAEKVEVIVVDDGSTDRSLDVLAAFDDDPRVITIAQENRGQAAALVAGIERAGGDYVCLLDSDDYFAPDKLTRVAERLRAIAPRPEHVFLCNDLRILEGAAGEPVGQTWFQMHDLVRFGAALTLDASQHPFPFATTSGEVFSRELIAWIAGTLPCFEWRRGPDSVITHAAMLASGVVHYLHEPLTVYRIHGGNQWSSMRDGRYVIPRSWRRRWPRLLRYLESLLDVLDLSPRARDARVAYLHRLERAVRAQAAGRRVYAPRVSFVVAAPGGMSGLSSSLAAIANQSHPNTEAVVVPIGDAATAGEDVLAGARERPEHLAVSERVGEGAWMQSIASGYRAAGGDYLVLLAAGDEPDPDFVDRHLFAHQHVSPATMSCSDLRLVDEHATLVHASYLANARRWPSGFQLLAPFAHAVDEWPFSPPSGAMLRRTPMLDCLAAHEAAQTDGETATWLWLQLAHLTGGTLLIGECLLSRRVAIAGALSVPPEKPWQASMEVRPPAPVAAALALLDLCCRNRRAFAANRLQDWVAALVRWVAQSYSRQVGEHLSRLAGELNDPVLAGLVPASEPPPRS